MILKKNHDMFTNKKFKNIYKTKNKIKKKNRKKHTNQ